MLREIKFEIKDGQVEWPLGDEEYAFFTQRLDESIASFCEYVDYLVRDLVKRGSTPNEAAGYAYMLAVYPYNNIRVIKVKDSQKYLDEIHELMIKWENGDA